jgi:hypothetical protein
MCDITFYWLMLLCVTSRKVICHLVKCGLQDLCDTSPIILISCLEMTCQKHIAFTWLLTQECSDLQHVNCICHKKVVCMSHFCVTFFPASVVSSHFVCIVVITKCIPSHIVLTLCHTFQAYFSLILCPHSFLFISWRWTRWWWVSV